MGVPTQLTAPRGARRGIALPSALFALVAVMVLALGVVGLADARLRAAKDREASTRAVLLAQEGVAHGLTILRDSLKGTSMTRLLRGSDNAYSTTAGHSSNTDNGVLAGYTLSNAINIPAAGRVTSRGTYKVQIMDDPQDPTAASTVSDGNLRIILRCTAETTDGGKAVVDAMIVGRPNFGVVVDGSLRFNGAASQVRGNCGNVHVNGNVSAASSPGPQIAGLTTTGSATGFYRDTLNTTLTPSLGAATAPAAALDLAELCSRTQYYLQDNGWLLDRNTGLSYDANSIMRNGWQRTSTTTPATWTLAGASAVAGSYCTQGVYNVVVNGNIGTDLLPLRLTVISPGGSIYMGGTPFLQPASADSVLLAAGGDLRIAGNAGSANANYEGLLYANANCIIEGTARIFGSVVCRNQGQPGTAAEYNTSSGPATAQCPSPNSCIGGAVRITHTCNGWLNGTPQIKAWWQPAS